LDKSNLSEAPGSSGIYAIATKTGWSYDAQYVGRSGRSIRGRLENHLSGRGNRVICGILENKRERPGDPTQALCFAFLATRKHKLIEAAYIDADDRPIGNLIRARLPEGLQERKVCASELD
jgi:hypothetical protein